jgi:perosamine synthetase
VIDSAAANVEGHSVPEFVPRLIEALLSVAPEGGVLHEPEFSDTEREYVTECIETGWVSSVGKFVDRFEGMLCETTGAEFTVATVNGTAALHTALHLAGVLPGEEVLVPAFGFIATANAVSQCAAIPHFVDVNEQTLAVDAPALEKYLGTVLELKDGLAINRVTGRRVRALMVAHILGHPADMTSLLDVASQFGLMVVEDAAESLGGFRDGQHTGTFGLVGALSFNGNKTITTGGGGAVVTNDPEIGARAKHLTTTAKKPHAWEFDHDAIGFNYRMPNLNAALGCAQLEKLPDFLARKRVLAGRYQSALAGIDQVAFAAEPPGTISSYWLNAILLDPAQEDRRDEIHRSCHNRGIMTRSAWKPLNSLLPYAHCPAMPVPVTEGLYRRMIKLPSSPHLAG